MSWGGGRYLAVGHVQVKVQVAVQRRCDARPAGSKMEEVAVVTGSTAGGVVRSAGGAGAGGGAHHTGHGPLAGGLLRRTAAAPPLLGEGAQGAALAAVEQRLDPGPPGGEPPAITHTH